MKSCAHVLCDLRLLASAVAGLALLIGTAAPSAAQTSGSAAPTCSMPAPAELDSIAQGLAQDLLQPSDISLTADDGYLRSATGASRNDMLVFRLAEQMPEFVTQPEAAIDHAQSFLAQTCREIGAVTGYNGRFDHVDSQLIKFGSAQGASDYMTFTANGMIAPADPADAWTEVPVASLGDETRAFTAISPDGPLGKPGPMYLTTFVFRRGDTLGFVQLIGDNTNRTSLDRTQRLGQLIAERMSAGTGAVAVEQRP